MQTYSDIPDQIRETVQDRLPNNLDADQYRLEYNNQNKGYLYFTVAEDDNSTSVTISLVIRAISSYGRTNFGRIAFPEDRDHFDDREHRILFSFEGDA
jgi:hypothetical protein